MKMITLYYIYWKSKVTGATGHGTRAFPKAEAQRYADELSKKFPEITHWIERAESEPNMPTLDQSFCFCCDEIITWNGSFWQHPDGTKHLNPARPIDELERLRAQVIDLEKQLAAVRMERDHLRELLDIESAHYGELPY